MRTLLRARWLVVALMVAVLTLTGCTAPKPGVTFYGNRVAVAAQPALWCTVDYSAGTGSCPSGLATEKYVQLRLRPGDPVQISVAPEIGSGPWQVIYQYATPDGTVKTTGSGLLDAGQLAFTLRPPTKDDQLVHVEVQSTPVLLPTVTGQGVQIGFAHLWALDVIPVV